MPARVPLPDQLQAPFRVGQGLDSGMGVGRLRGSDLERPFWGIRAPRQMPRDIAGMVRAYLPRMSPNAFFSHATAAQLWNIPLPSRMAASLPLHVSVAPPRRAPEGRGIVGHRTAVASRDVVRIGAAMVTSPERTICDLAAVLDDEELLAALDNILWRRRLSSTRATPQSIEESLFRFAGRRGRSRLTALLPLASDRSDSPPESAFRLRFVRAGFPTVVPNREIRTEDGRFLALPDLQFPEYRMAFDYEGDHHRTDAKQWRKDLRRVPMLEDARWHHTRLSAADLADPRYVVARTRRLLMERGWSP